MLEIALVRYHNNQKLSLETFSRNTRDFWIILGILILMGFETVSDVVFTYSLFLL